MTINLHVTSLELSKKLKELGVKQQSYFYWRDNDGYDECNGDYSIVSHINPDITTWYASAFLLSELLDMIPNSPSQGWDFDFNIEYTTSTAVMGGRYYSCISFDNNNEDEIFYDNNTANAVAESLIYLIEKKIMSMGGKA